MEKSISSQIEISQASLPLPCLPHPSLGVVTAHFPAEGAHVIALYVPLVRPTVRDVLNISYLDHDSHLQAGLYIFTLGINSSLCTTLKFAQSPDLPFLKLLDPTSRVMPLEAKHSHNLESRI